MNAPFQFLEWYNENYTGEHLILAVLGFFCGVGVVTYIFVDPQMLNFSLFLGGGLALNMYAVMWIQRKYISQTQEKLNDIDYLPPEAETDNTGTGSLDELSDFESVEANDEVENQ